MADAKTSNFSNKTNIIIRLITFVLPTIFIIFILNQPYAEPKWMFLDPLTAAELSNDCCHTYYGFISNLGVMLWSGTATVLLVLAVVFYKTSKKELFYFAASSGVLTGWLALDDMFMVHELVLPSFGVPQNLVLASYILLTVIYIITSWRIILQSDFWILFIGGLALSISVFVDTYFHSLTPSLVYLEDSAKFFGIVCWASFHITTSYSFVIIELKNNE